MAVMTVQPPLPLAPGGVQVGDAVAVLVDADGGRVFVHGVLTFAWDAGDDAGRVLAAVQLVRTKAATAVDVAAGFGMGRETLRRWVNRAAESGVAGVVPAKRGPKGPSKVGVYQVPRTGPLLSRGCSRWFSVEGSVISSRPRRCSW